MKVSFIYLLHFTVQQKKIVKFSYNTAVIFIIGLLDIGTKLKKLQKTFLTLNLKYLINLSKQPIHIIY